MALDTRDQGVLLTMGEAFSRKGNLDRFWQTVADNHYPERASFTRPLDLGEEATSQLYSSEPVLFRREFGNFLNSALRPRGRDWFSMAPANVKLRKRPKVLAYLDEKRDMLRALLYNRGSGYTRAMVEADHDFATFGNAVGTVEERPDRSGLLFRTWHLRDCAWLQNYEGEVDTVFRKFRPTIRELMAQEKRRGWKIDPKLAEVATKEPLRKVNCVHVQMPLLSYQPEKKAKLEWVSLYYDIDHQCLMSRKLVPEFNYFVDRWSLLNESPYAISPCVICSLPDSRTLQVMTWSVIEAGEKAVEPPMVATHGAVVGGVNIAAAQVTWVDKNYDERTGDAIRALELGTSPQFGEVLREGIRNNLNAAWYLNKLLMPQTYDKTAYEANRLHEEFLRAVQPIMEPAEAERNGNHLDLAFAISQRLGLWGDPKAMPEELAGQDIDFTYDNPYEDSRKQALSLAYKATAEVNQIAAATDPTVMAQFNGKKAYRDAISGVAPPSWLLDEDEAEEAMAKAEEEQTLAGAAQEVAGAAEIEAKMQPKGQMQAAA